MSGIFRSLFRTVSVAAVSLTVVGSEAQASDGQREGFVLGFGMGFGSLVTYDREVDAPIGLQTDLTIGAGLSDRIQLHYTGKQFWYTSDGTFFTLGYPMVGLTYYLKPQAPSFFLSASVGASVGIAFWEGGGGILAGPGFHTGVGYEFSPHWSFKFDVVRSHMPASDWNPWNFIFTVNVLRY